MEIKPGQIVTLHEWAAHPKTTYLATSEPSETGYFPALNMTRMAQGFDDGETLLSEKSVKEVLMQANEGFRPIVQTYLKEKLEKKYFIMDARDEEWIYDVLDSQEEAEERVRELEKQDKEEGHFSPNYYAIIADEIRTYA